MKERSKTPEMAEKAIIAVSLAKQDIFMASIQENLFDAKRSFKRACAQAHAVRALSKSPCLMREGQHDAIKIRVQTDAKIRKIDMDVARLKIAKFKPTNAFSVQRDSILKDKITITVQEKPQPSLAERLFNRKPKEQDICMPNFGEKRRLSSLF